MRVAKRWSARWVALALVVAACGGGSHLHPGRAGSGRRSTRTPPTTAARPVRVDTDVAALPDGHGAKLAIVVDDLGGADTYLAGYLALPVPLTLSIIPSLPRAGADDATVHSAGKEVLLHLPLANHPGPAGPGRLAATAPAEVVDRFVADALARVPHAVGANNHEGPYGSSSPPLMLAVLGALKARGLFFLDSVTSQRTVGFALERALGMPPRINNIFMDHFESDADSRRALLALATIAARNGAAIGICHVFHAYELHALAALARQLEARGYVFTPLSQTTDAPAAGLDSGVRTR